MNQGKLNGKTLGLAIGFTIFSGSVCGQESYLLEVFSPEVEDVEITYIYIGDEISESEVPEELREEFLTQDYWPWDVRGVLPNTCFVGRFKEPTFGGSRVYAGLARLEFAEDRLFGTLDQWPDARQDIDIDLRPNGEIEGIEEFYSGVYISICDEDGDCEPPPRDEGPHLSKLEGVYEPIEETAECFSMLSDMLESEKLE